ncbi:prepilin-type N-terminal cleavage/methylation domain-containing protein [Patescibacteria group bacterium]|nr:prepilin-type N-terminal cleavage/methylation domain-containing protein [Patescibacteria group bacterium]
MRRTRSTKSNEHGFTLLEVVVSIMVAAILGTLMYQYSQTALSSTVTPIIQLSNIQDLNDVMEKITGDYQAKFADPATPSTGWIESFGNTMVTKYGAEVDNITSELGTFANNIWTSNPSGKNIKIVMFKGNQSLTALFSD